MRLFIDTANIEEIREAGQMGIVSGVTTNPTLVAKEKGDFREIIAEICRLVDGPISAEVIATRSDGMVEEAVKLAGIHQRVVVKIPMTGEGLKAVYQLRKKGIRTNVTLVFSANQALLAARAGASYVSPFVGRLDDIGHDGIAITADIAEIFRLHRIETEIIAASIRHPKHVMEAARARADIATVPFGVLQQMLKHPLTDLGVERFLADWEKKQS